MKLAKTFKGKNISKSGVSGLGQKRGYADDHHHADAHLYKSDVVLHQSYLNKWGFLPDEQLQKMQDDLERELDEIHAKHEKIRLEKIKNWTLEERFPWYTKEQLQERNETMSTMKRIYEEAKVDRQKRIENQKPLPFEPTYENVFGAKSREMLWKRFFRINGNKAPAEPKSVIRVTSDAPFDTTNWSFYSNPIHCEQFKQQEYDKLHPTRILRQKLLYEEDPTKWPAMEAELNEVFPSDESSYYILNGDFIPFDDPFEDLQFPIHN